MIHKLLNGGDKKHLTRRFLFFFTIAICSYLTLMVCHSPYNDDYFRYLENIQVGVAYCRTATTMLEFLLFWAPTSYDASPFFMILSCAFLACSALICEKTLDTVSRTCKASLSDSMSLWCFVPIVVNPYLAECMIFRFDNPFMMLSMLCSIGAAYVSVCEQYETNLIDARKSTCVQLFLLLFCLFVYQMAIAAYFIIFAYVLLLNLSKNKSIGQIILEMRHWFQNVFVTLTIYLFTITLIYLLKIKSIFQNVLPNSPKKIIDCLTKNIYLYFHGLYFDWSSNAVGIIFLLVFVVFSVSFVIDVWKNIESKSIAIFRIAMISIGLAIFLLCPLGAGTAVNLWQHEVHGGLVPRLLYTFGILISCVLYKNYLFVESRKILRILYKPFLFFFALWNITYMNSFGNIMHMQKTLQDKVFYDLANDFYEIKNSDTRFSSLSIIGNILTPAADNFFKLYPINSRILPEYWDVAIYCMLGLYIRDINDRSLKRIDKKEVNLHDKVLLKSKQWYDIYSIGGSRIFVELKGVDSQNTHIALFADPLVYHWR